MSPGKCGSLPRMTHTTCHVTISLDGYLAGPEHVAGLTTLLPVVPIELRNTVMRGLTHASAS